MNYIIETQNLTKCYGEHAAVRDVTLPVPQGAIYGLLGRNGAGKTTVMKMLLGLARPTSGSILLFGLPMKGFPRDIYNRIGSSIEAPGFYPQMTAKENLTIFSRLTRKPDPSQIEQSLDTVDLSSDSQKTFSQYSLGMKQRLALANALLKSPRLLILDEPANGLDLFFRISPPFAPANPGQFSELLPIRRAALIAAGTGYNIQNPGGAGLQLTQRKRFLPCLFRMLHRLYNIVHILLAARHLQVIPCFYAQRGGRNGILMHSRAKHKGRIL
ncbi:ABC transporter ATP-binding protein [Eisenbergiella porci]|uniref:ATP-binding cassette domain-containing protein n=1 Tax=Eisenbergiella porci TaxID=2652274 RepID=A0A6N7WF93_9FIRM|nr:ATP-binding cassette domain-containing protein [Eisenbergiella porci]